MDRKQWKTAAHQAVKQHYLLFTAVCLTAVMFGTEFGVMPNTTVNYYSNFIQQLASDPATSSLQMMNASPIGHLLLKMYTAGVQTGVTLSANVMLGIISILYPVLYFLIFVFILQVICVILRRIILEGRTYHKVPLQHVFYLAGVHKWFHAAAAYFEYMASLFLWSLTIVGGFIKYYSYFCAPFILAENPSVTGKQALTLSRKMMDGHKKEAFVLDLSLLGWYLLSIVTLGIAGIFYTNAYTTAVHAEYYAHLRQAAKDQNIEGNDLLNDPCLFAKAEDAVLATAYKSTRMDEMYIADTEVKLTGAKKFFAENLAVWTGSTKQRKVYQGVENLKCQLAEDKDALAGELYPSRLSPLYTKENIHFDGNLNPFRVYSLPVLFLLFLLGSFAAWLMSGAWFANASTGSITKFGVLAGPWMPLYGVIGILSLLLSARFRKHPVPTLISSAVLTGIAEYLTAVVLNQNYGLRWWDYTRYYLNFNGFTCAQSMIACGLLCTLAVYVIAPAFDQWLSRRSQKAVLVITLILLVLFAADAVLSCSHPNTSSAIAAVMTNIHIL